MNILLLGGGGREHALAWKIAQSPLCEALFIAPGNAGMGTLGRLVALDIDSPEAVCEFARTHAIDLVVIGPEAPLANGVADALDAAKIAVFGPSKAAAQLEASKGFTKAICDACNAPTAAYAHFDNAASARAYVEQQGAPIVIKADGLAAGKGVVVAMTLKDALAAIDDMFAGSFGAAGAEVVVEEFMEGEEASFFVLCDGENVLPLATAQDHKRAFDGDQGPNTGGMGAYSPAPVLTDDVAQKALDEIVKPVVAEMAARGTPFKGILYAGLMIKDGQPRLVEFNTRFGDPECQVLMMRLQSDIVPALLACAQGTLDQITLDWSADPAMTVVMAARGYPGSYAKGCVISGLEKAQADDNLVIFHAGTKLVDGKLTANGGRVLNITASGKDIAQARDRAYQAIGKINWKNGFCRSDIGWRAL